jgi:hypothetical protein
MVLSKRNCNQKMKKNGNFSGPAAMTGGGQQFLVKSGAGWQLGRLRGRFGNLPHQL